VTSLRFRRFHEPEDPNCSTIYITNQWMTLRKPSIQAPFPLTNSFSNFVEWVLMSSIQSWLHQQIPVQSRPQERRTRTRNFGAWRWESERMKPDDLKYLSKYANERAARHRLLKPKNLFKSSLTTFASSDRRFERITISCVHCDFRGPKRYASTMLVFREQSTNLSDRIQKLGTNICYCGLICLQMSLEVGKYVSKKFRRKSRNVCSWILRPESVSWVSCQQHPWPRWLTT